MGRKSMYCVFHSLEGSGNQNRNGIQCGFVEGTNESKCKAFQAYGFASREQRDEIKEIQKIASSNGLRYQFSLTKIRQLHQENNWDWKLTNTGIYDYLKHVQQQLENVQGNHQLILTLELPKTAIVKSINNSPKIANSTETQPILNTITATTPTTTITTIPKITTIAPPQPPAGILIPTTTTTTKLSELNLPDDSIFLNQENTPSLSIDAFKGLMCLCQIVESNVLCDCENSCNCDR